MRTFLRVHVNKNRLNVEVALLELNLEYQFVIRILVRNYGQDNSAYTAGRCSVCRFIRIPCKLVLIIFPDIRSMRGVPLLAEYKMVFMQDV